MFHPVFVCCAFVRSAVKLSLFPPELPEHCCDCTIESSDVASLVYRTYDTLQQHVGHLAVAHAVLTDFSRANAYPRSSWQYEHIDPMNLDSRCTP